MFLGRTPSYIESTVFFEVFILGRKIMSSLGRSACLHPCCKQVYLNKTSCRICLHPCCKQVYLNKTSCRICLHPCCKQVNLNKTSCRICLPNSLVNRLISRHPAGSVCTLVVNRLISTRHPAGSACALVVNRLISARHPAGSACLHIRSIVQWHETANTSVLILVCKADWWLQKSQASMAHRDRMSIWFCRSCGDD